MLYRYATSAYPIERSRAESSGVEQSRVYAANYMHSNNATHAMNPREFSKD